MNVSRLHASLDEIVASIQATNPLQGLTNLQNTLQVAVSQQTVEASAAVKNAYDILYKSLSRCKTNDALPTRRMIYEEIGATAFIGKGLLDRVEKALRGEGLTPTLTVQSIAKLINEVNQFQTLINGMHANFKALKLERDSLPPGEGELGFSIPKDSFDPTAKKFQLEVKKVLSILDTFNEIATANEGAITVRQISSSDWQLYFSCALNVLVVLPAAIEKIIDLLNKYLDYKKKLTEFESAKFPEETIKPIRDYLEKYIPAERRVIAEKMIAEHAKSVDGGRKNELETQLDMSLAKLMDLLASGATIEVRATPPAKADAPKSEDPKAIPVVDPEYEKLNALVIKVNEKGNAIRQIRLKEKVQLLPAPDELDKEV